MRIGIDICNTLADVNGQLAKVLGRDPKPFEYGLGSLDPSRVFREHPEVFANAEPLPGSVNSVRALARHGEIFYVTSRPVWAKRLTQSWLLRHGFPQAPLVVGVPKVEAVRVLGLDAFVEDCPEELERLGRLCRVLPIGWPYNGETSGWAGIIEQLMEGVNPVCDWGAIIVAR